jgi:hypothetical protein
MATNLLRSPRLRAGVALAACLVSATWASAQPSRSQSQSRSQLRTSASTFVPGTGTEIEYVGDDFEDHAWGFEHRHPKSSREQDERVRSPMGESTNDRWHEGPERGQPDQIVTIPTPPFGIVGSQRALLLRTLNSGIPGTRTNDVQQDDLIANVINRLRGDIPVGERPSCTVRVYLPPVEQWEQRSGPQFGYRASLSTITTTSKKVGLFSMGSTTEAEPYWPGMWIHFRAKNTKNTQAGTAYIAVRGDRLGRDFAAREISEFGWWTLGMSFSQDGMVHYYASPGVDDLTQADYITSQYPYSYTARDFRTYFFDVCNRNDGRTWSTPFVIDDPKLFIQNAGRVQSIVKRQEEATIRNAERQREMAERNAQRQAQLEERRAAQREANAQRQASRRSSGSANNSTRSR